MFPSLLLLREEGKALLLSSYLAAARSEVVRGHGEGEAQSVRAVVPRGRQVAQVGLVRLQQRGGGRQKGSLQEDFTSYSPGGCSINTGLPGRTQLRPSWKEYCMFMEQLSRKDNSPSLKDNCPSPKDNFVLPAKLVRTLVFPEGHFELESSFP